MGDLAKTYTGHGRSALRQPRRTSGQMRPILRPLPDNVLKFRIEQTRDAISAALGLIAKGRGSLASQFLAGAVGLIDRDLGGAL
jgi:hypothetical protein